MSNKLQEFSSTWCFCACGNRFQAIEIAKQNVHFFSFSSSCCCLPVYFDILLLFFCMIYNKYVNISNVRWKSNWMWLHFWRQTFLFWAKSFNLKSLPLYRRFFLFSLRVENVNQTTCTIFRRQSFQIIRLNWKWLNWAWLDLPKQNHIFSSRN